MADNDLPQNTFSDAQIAEVARRTPPFTDEQLKQLGDRYIVIPKWPLFFVLAVLAIAFAIAGFSTYQAAVDKARSVATTAAVSEVENRLPAETRTQIQQRLDAAATLVAEAEGRLAPGPMLDRLQAVEDELSTSLIGTTWESLSVPLRRNKEGGTQNAPITAEYWDVRVVFASIHVKEGERVQIWFNEDLHGPGREFVIVQVLPGLIGLTSLRTAADGQRPEYLVSLELFQPEMMYFTVFQNNLNGPVAYNDDPCILTGRKN